MHLDDGKVNKYLYIVGCRGVVLLGGLVPLRLSLVSLFYSLKVPLRLKIKNTKSHHLLTKDLFIIKRLRMKRSLVKLSGLVKALTKMGTGCIQMIKVVIFTV